MRVVCLGSGNVASHMAAAFKAKGAELLQVWSRSLENAQALAGKLGALATNDLGEVDLTADLYLIAVKDDAIANVAEHLRGLNALVLHTSGATSIDVLKKQGLKQYGVLYPLQTFSKSKALDFSKVPLCLEADSPETLIHLQEIAGSLSPLVYNLSSDDRKIVHVAAVFACNFTNHLYQLGQEILQHHHLDFELLKPLILETAEKVQVASPFDVQTGPAVRNDEQTMENHLDLLKDRPDLEEIYKTLSKSIKKTYL